MERGHPHEVRCPHGHNPFTCNACRQDTSSLISFTIAKQKGWLRDGTVPLTKREESIISVLDWQLPPQGEPVGWCGYFATGPMSEAAEREPVIAGMIAEKLEAGGSPVLVWTFDDILTYPSGADLVDRVLFIGSKIGARDADGKPRTIIATGFSQSKRLTEAGVRDALTWSLSVKQDQAGAKRMMDFLLELRGQPDKDRFVNEHISNISERERVWALFLAYRYVAGSSWQAIATRKNSPRDTIQMGTVAPDEIYLLLNAFQTGGNGASYKSDMVARWEETALFYSSPYRVDD